MTYYVERHALQSVTSRSGLAVRLVGDGKVPSLRVSEAVRLQNSVCPKKLIIRIWYLLFRILKIV